MRTGFLYLVCLIVCNSRVFAPLFARAVPYLLICTHPASTGAGDLRLMRGTYFVAKLLEYVVVDVLLWVWCVLSAPGFRCCFRLLPANSRPTACISSCEAIKTRGNIDRMRNTRKTSWYPQRSSNVAHSHDGVCPRSILSRSTHHMV